MSAATFITWENRLSKLVREPGGVRIGQALEQSQHNLDEIQESCLQAIDLQMEELDRLCSEGGRSPADAVKDQIYDIANDVVAVAGAFALKELGQAAFSLCELVDRLRTRGKWNQAAIEVHLSAFRLLRQRDPDADRSSIIQGLMGLTDRVAAIAE